MEKGKRRTRQHIIADLSVNYFEKFVLEAGFVLCKFESSNDYGYDLLLLTYTEEGEIENGKIYVQMKATDSIKIGTRAATVLFTLDKRDIRLWVSEIDPVILVLFDAVGRRAYWLHVQDYFSVYDFNGNAETKTVNVHIPLQQTINLTAIKKIANIKRNIYNRLGKIF
jgi:hypothetical protein